MAKTKTTSSRKRAPKAERKPRKPRAAAVEAATDGDSRMPIVYSRFPAALKTWLDQLCATYGLKQADVLRRIVEDANRNSWNPVDSMKARADAFPE